MIVAKMFMAKLQVRGHQSLKPMRILEYLLHVLANILQWPRGSLFCILDKYENILDAFYVY